TPAPGVHDPAGEAKPARRGKHAEPPRPVVFAPPDPASMERLFRERIDLWEDLLTLVVDPDSPKIEDRERKLRLLAHLIERGGLDAEAFWRLGRGQRGRAFLTRYSRLSRDIPQLEITAF